MSILTVCPGCARTLKIRDDLAGRTIQCPKCNASVAVQGAAPPSAKWQETVPIYSAETKPATKPAARRPPPAAPPAKAKPAQPPRPVAREEPAPEPQFAPELIEEDDEPAPEEDLPRKKKKKGSSD